MPQQRPGHCPSNAFHPLPTKHLHGACHATAAYSLVARPFRSAINRRLVLDVTVDRVRQYIRHNGAFMNPLLLSLPDSVSRGFGRATYTLGDMPPLS